MNYLHPDLHLHSVVSDGTDSPAELLEKIRRSPVDLFSLTDHDTFDGCASIQAQLRPDDPAFLYGIELSCEDRLGKYHILGYCYNAGKTTIREAVEVTHTARREKAMNRIRFLQEEYHVPFTEQEIEALLQNENPGKPHFVSLLLKKNIISDKAEGFSLMNHYHGHERRLTPEEAIEAILRSDGIPVLAHGILGDGSQVLSEEEVTARVGRLKQEGLMGVEAYYSTYTPEQRALMLSLADRFDLFVTAGSDYHGKNKPVALGENGNPDPERMHRFYLAVDRLLRQANK